MNELFGYLTCVAMSVAGIWYVPLIIKRRVTPAPATWIMGSTAMMLSLVAYRATKRPLLDNITLVAAAIEITVIMLVLLVVLYRARALKVEFDILQKVCLVVMCLVLGYWLLHRNDTGARVTYWTTQILLVVAYIATVGRVLRRKVAFDSVLHWSLVLLTSLFGAVPAFLATNTNVYGIGNSVRAVVFSAITVSLLCLYDRRAQWSRVRDEISTNLELLRRLIGKEG